MNASATRPRPDQVAELTRDIRLPLPAITEIHLQVLAEGICGAFEDLRIRMPHKLRSADEPEVNTLIETTLNRWIDKDTLWGQLVDSVSRGKESVSFDGSKLETRPDFSIYLSDRTRRFPLVVEAKILDAPNAKTVTLYCKHGLIRFVNGDYAWGNHEALMIGYIRDGSSIDTKLKKFLAEDMALTSPKYRVKQLPVHVGSGTLDFAYTQHDRVFVYNCQPQPNNPGPISVWHLWLS